MVWIALRTSGPDPEADRIESILVRITDKKLVIRAEADPIEVGEDPARAEAAALELVKAHVSKEAGLLAGTRVQAIRLFLAPQMPALFDYLHYRNVDVATVRELVRRWYPEVYAARPSAVGLDALEHAIEELRYYRDNAFLAAPSTPSPDAPEPS